MAKCRDVMTKDPVFCQPGDSITKVAGILKQEDVGSVPVVESVESRKLVGIITDRDIVVKVVAEGRAPDAATVKEAMTPNPVSCREDDDLEYAVKLMKERQVRCAFRAYRFLGSYPWRCLGLACLGPLARVELSPSGTSGELGLTFRRESGTLAVGYGSH